jgi:DNA mismatch repair protein MutS
LALLEKTESKKGVRDGPLDELPLFAVTRPQGPPVEVQGPSPVDKAVDAIKPDELTPRAALDAIYRLKTLRNAKTKPKR